MANKAYVFRIYPNAEQRILFAKTFGCTRFVYNKMLSDKIEHYNSTGEKLNTTPANYKAEFEWLKEVDSLALANAGLNLETAYNNFFRFPQVGFPKFKAKHRSRRSYTTNMVNNNIAIFDNHIKLPKVGLVKMVKHRDIPANYKIKSVTVSQKPSGEYYVSILFYYEREQIEKVAVKKVIGLDYSMKEIYISSDGEKPNNKHYYRTDEERLKREQRKLSHMEKGSNNYIKQRIRIAKIHQRIANRRLDFTHKESSKIANYYDAVAVENLNMQSMSQSLNFGKSVHDNGWGMFITQLTYKLEDRGKQLIKIDKWFPSSKTCSVCGRKKDELSLKERVYVCECGNILDRDINAAINIRNEGMRMLGIA